MKLQSKSIIIKSFHKNLITIDFNESCNNKCKNCPRSTRIPDADNSKYWTFEQSKMLIDYLVKTCSPYSFHIGILSEFCIHPDAGKILDYLNKTYPNIDITCTVNLTNLSDDLFNAIITGNDKLTLNISMWAWDFDSYRELHGTMLFNKFDANLKKLVSNINNISSKIMVSTVNISKTQHSKCTNYIRSICNEYKINLMERDDTRESLGNHQLTLYTNVYTDTRDKASKNVDIRNSTFNYKCDLPINGAYITYDKLYACPSSDVRAHFNINNLDDLGLKLFNIHTEGATLDMCKTCTVAYSCLNIGH